MTPPTPAAGRVVGRRAPGRRLRRYGPGRQLAGAYLQGDEQRSQVWSGSTVESCLLVVICTAPIVFRYGHYSLLVVYYSSYTCGVVMRTDIL